MATNGWSQQKFRVVGSAYTIFYYKGQSIFGCEMVQDQPPQPVASPEPIQPLDERHPIEIAFPRAAGAGSLVLRIKEQWDLDVWRMLGDYSSGPIHDIVDLLERSAAVGKVTCTKIITPPPGHKPRTVTYNGCVVVDADFSDNVAIQAMTIDKTITLAYTHTTRQGG